MMMQPGMQQPMIDTQPTELFTSTPGSSTLETWYSWLKR